MADYGQSQNQARSSTQGWYNAEQINRQGEVSRWQNELGKIDPYYQQLFDDLGLNQQKASNALVASMARRGLTRSGVRTRAEGNLAGEYGKMNERLGTEKREKTTEVETGVSNAQKMLGNLDTEWQDKINTLAMELYNQAVGQETAAQAAKQSSNSGGGYSNTSTSGYSSGKAARADYNADLDTLEAQLKAFQAAGYQGSIPSKTTLKSQLASEYDGWISSREINGYVDTLYKRYYLS